MFASLKCLSDRQFGLFTFVVIKHFTEKVNPRGWELTNLRKPELDLLIYFLLAAVCNFSPPIQFNKPI